MDWIGLDIGLDWIELQHKVSYHRSHIPYYISQPPVVGGRSKSTVARGTKQNQAGKQGMQLIDPRCAMVWYGRELGG